MTAPMDVADLCARAQRWIDDDPDQATREELRALLARVGPAGIDNVTGGDPAALADLADRFAGVLGFGTAGLRGVLAAGPNRMNRAVVARTTWAVARELLASVPGAVSRVVVVGFDGRRLSRELGEDVACILAASGLKVQLFRDAVPTPLVGFAVKQLHASGGIVVTASHNPPEYSGYKVYWDGAGQVIPPADARIADAIDRAPPARQVARPPADVLRARGVLVDAPGELLDDYRRAVRALAVHADAGDRAFSIVYTPLHGVGDALARAVLADAGFSNVTSVPEQQAPDGAFPTMAFPNPEEPGAMDLALAHASKRSAALVLANDPDADRLAVAIPDGAGGYRQLTGNELGVLLGHYLLTERAVGSGRRAVIATIVSSPMLGRIAAGLGAHYEETLTGFKWIAARAVALEQAGYELVFAYEEALGYCVGNAVRDKDGISAAALVAEVAAVLRARGESIDGALAAIARRFGVWKSAQLNVIRPGARGVAAIAEAVAVLRASPPASVGETAVVAIADYAAGVRRDRRAGSEAMLTLPKSSVLALELSGGHRIVVRPSGTEPKAKIYVDVLGSGEGAEARADEVLRDLTRGAADMWAAAAAAAGLE